VVGASGAGLVGLRYYAVESDDINRLESVVANSMKKLQLEGSLVLSHKESVEQKASRRNRAVGCRRDGKRRG
jgi:hypothetical protein